MSPVLVASLLLNIAVLVPVVVSLARDAAWTTSAYGPKSPARGILTSIYVAILIASAVLLWRGDVAGTAALLGVQILYKVTTPFSASPKNPVVVSNLAIAAWHATALVASR